MGGTSHVRRLGGRLSSAGGCCAGEPVESEPPANGGVRSVDQQPDVGRCAGEYTAHRQGGGPAADSVANASQLFALDRAYLTERIGKLGPKRFDQILVSIDIVLGR